MLRKLIKNKKAQNTAEYAILISLVVAGIIAMQTYAQRALQARVKDASAFMTAVNLEGLGNTDQYEPYYLSSEYNSTRTDAQARQLGQGLVARNQEARDTRAEGGFQQSDYTQYGLVNGV
jgi:Flp pilus assembly pilin Flp